MGYSKLTKKRNVQLSHVATNETRFDDNKPECKVPVYGSMFSLVVSLCTCLLGSIFFAYKWFSCLNYLIGRDLFKPLALTAVWTLLFTVGICAVLFNSFWLLALIWLGHLAVVVYLLSQLRKCRTCLESVARRLKISLGWISLLWFVETILILCCNMASIAICAPAFVLVETCMIQRMFNLVVYDALEDKSVLKAKMANDWHRFRAVMVWLMIILSVTLFVWDIIDTVLRILDIKYLTYHDFKIDGKFQIWLFFEEYYPHAGWQLCLWSVAFLIGKMPSRML